MNELQQLWYSNIQPVEGKDFFNYALLNKCLCSISIASVLDCELDLESKINLECIAYDVLPQEIGPLLFNLRRTGYPPADTFDSEHFYHLRQMIKVAKYFEISFIIDVLQNAYNHHTKTNVITMRSNLCDIDTVGRTGSNLGQEVYIRSPYFDIDLTMDDENIVIDYIKRKILE